MSEVNKVLTPITTLAGLCTFLPHLRALYEKGLNNYWYAESWEHFCDLLFEAFTGNNYFYGKIEDGKVLYFIGIQSLESNKAFFWLLYVDPIYRDHTTKTINAALATLKQDGFTSLTLTTRRTTSSYDRWVTKKFKAKLLSKTYKIEL